MKAIKSLLFHSLFVLLGLGMFVSGSKMAQAQFSPGVVLTASALNAALSHPTITSGTIGGITGFGIRSSGAAFDLQMRNTEVLTASRMLTISVNNAARNLTIGGDVNFGAAVTTTGALTTAGAFTTSGAFATTLTMTAPTTLTLPVTGTLSTLAGIETFTNKTVTRLAQTVQVLTDAAPTTWDMANGAFATLAMATGSHNISAPTNMPSAGHAVLRITQGGAGSFVPTFNAAYKWAGGTQPTFSTTVGKIDKVDCDILDGVNLLCRAILDVR